MNPSVFLEKNISQQPALELLQAMGYTYIATRRTAPPSGGAGIMCSLRIFFEGSCGGSTVIALPERKMNSPPGISSAPSKIWMNRWPKG